MSLCQMFIVSVKEEEQQLNIRPYLSSHHKTLSSINSQKRLRIMCSYSRTNCNLLNHQDCKLLIECNFLFLNKKLVSSSEKKKYYSLGFIIPLVNTKMNQCRIVTMIVSI